jgi:ABC-type transport system involved in multi-copper enzyme maturation permease subunit
VTGPHLLVLWQAEVYKLYSRTSAWVGLALAALVGMALPLGLYVARAAVLSQTPVDATEDRAYILEHWILAAPEALGWGLTIRNLFVLRLILIMLGALSFAGEYQSRTLREDLIRPVPRWSVLGAKWLALCTWILMTVVITWVAAAAPSALLYGLDGDWRQATLAYLVTIPADAGFAAMVLAIATLTRSVSGTIVGTFLFYALDGAVGIGLRVVGWAAPMIRAPLLANVSEKVTPWLPSSAFYVWHGYAEAAWSWQGFVSLALVTLVSLALAERVFANTDVP